MKIGLISAICLLSQVYVTVLKEFPDLENVLSEDWDFFISVLAFHLCVLKMLKLELSEKEQKKHFLENFERWKLNYPNFANIFNDFTKYIESVTDEVKLLERMSIWLACNLFDKDLRNISHEELNIGINAVKMVKFVVESEI